MLNNSEKTPCPAQINLQASVIRMTPFADVTKGLDYTTNGHAAFRHADPTRRKPLRPGRSILSHQTATSKSEHNGSSTEEPSHGSRYQLQGQRRANRCPINTNDHDKSLVGDRHRLSARLKGKRGSFLIHEGDQEDSTVKTAPLRKEPRRRTIYVPSEDTTILTIHPGGIKHDPRTVAPTVVAIESVDTYQGQISDNKSSSVHSRQQDTLVAAPKRAPLQPNLKMIQQSWWSHDRPGSGPGKENLVPQTATIHDSRKISEIRSLEREPGCARVKVGRGILAVPFSSVSGDGLKRAKGSIHSKPYMENSKHVKVLRHSARIPCHKVIDGSIRTSLNNVTLKSSTRGNAGRTERSTRPLPSRLELPLVPQKNRNSKNAYSLLQEDIYRPELYEEAWMSDQESALAQLGNALFEAADAGEEPAQNTEHTTRRQVLLRLYQEPSTVLLFKRLEASILCGALRVPKDSSEEVSRLKHDVGFRRKFIDIWMKTFDPSKLRAAAEIVIGREVSATSSPMTKQQTSHPPTGEVPRKNLEIFIDECLLRNEDSLAGNIESPNGSDFGSTLWSRRRTILRSLMILFILDKSKELQLVNGNLFLRTSNLKSTEAFLKEISRLLLPCIGDIIRPLGRLGFRASHVQYPLCDYEYRFDSLATAFRDGIRLTRLVELLLYPPETLVRREKHITVALPTGEMLTTSVSDHRSWVLSQHLIFPCIGRSQKVYNVEIALSALQGVQGIEQIADKVTAADFVDGHREKTMVTLWGLVGKWGIGILVDCIDLNKEVHRLKRLRDNTDDRECGVNQYDKSDDESNLEGPEKHTQLLEMWARNIAQLHGLTVSNLTTSFADGRVFTAIVDEYERYLPHHCKTTRGSVEGTGDLASRLRRIGCSACFGKTALFSSFYACHAS